MKRIFSLLFACALLASCERDPIEIRPQAAVVSLNIHKVTTAAPVEILVNHYRLLSPTDTSHFIGNIDWGDGNITEFDNVAGGSINYPHNYIVAGLYNIKITFDKPTAVTSLSFIFRGVTQTDTLLSLTGHAGTPYLKYLVLQNTRLKTLDISANFNIERLWLSGNCLTEATVNNLLTHVDSYTVSNLTPSPEFYLNGQIPIAPPTGSGLVAKQSLFNKRCQIQTD